MLAQGFGGAERLFVDMCLALQRRGIKVQAICKKGSESTEKLAEHPGVTVEEINVLGTWDPLASRKIYKLLQLHGSNIVQAHLARASLLAGKACQKAKLPLVVTTHNYINPKYYENVSVLLPPTESQADYYKSRGVDPKKIRAIPHFSLIEPVTEVESADRNSLRLVSVGRLVEKKGYHVLFRAIAALKEKSDIRIELFIGGAGPEEKRLRDLSEKLSLGKEVHFVGWVDNVREFLSQADIFVLPSLDEPFGIVVLEAMASGACIISTKTSGPSEILNDKIAWLVKTGDVDSMAKALYEACRDKKERMARAAKALEVFRSTYSEGAVLPEFIALYENLVSKNQTQVQR